MSQPKPVTGLVGGAIIAGQMTEATKQGEPPCGRLGCNHARSEHHERRRLAGIPMPPVPACEHCGIRFTKLDAFRIVDRNSLGLLPLVTHRKCRTATAALAQKEEEHGKA